MKPINKKFPNVFIDKGRLFTKALSKESLFDERIIKQGKESFREWDPKRSKLAAVIMKKISQTGIKEGDILLYLGASHGYTPSFVADMIGEDGFLIGIEFSPESARDFVFLCDKRKNMCPVLGDCNHPEHYKDDVVEADVVYQDIAQRNQVQIFLKNCDVYLKKEGFGLLALKARSIDVTTKPKELYKKVRLDLEKHPGMVVVDYRELDPFEKDHAFFVVKKK